MSKVLEGLGLTMDEFIDLCILLGCDYCSSIRGVGPVRAIALIKEHKNIETILKHLDPKKYPGMPRGAGGRGGGMQWKPQPKRASCRAVPEDWPYKQARELFRKPEVLSGAECELKWTAPDVDGLVDFMCKKHGFQFVFAGMRLSPHLQPTEPLPCLPHAGRSASALERRS